MLTGSGFLGCLPLFGLCLPRCSIPGTPLALSEKKHRRHQHRNYQWPLLYTRWQQGQSLIRRGVLHAALSCSPAYSWLAPFQWHAKVPLLQPVAADTSCSVFLLNRVFGTTPAAPLQDIYFDILYSAATSASHAPASQPQAQPASQPPLHDLVHLPATHQPLELTRPARCSTSHCRTGCSD
jgi:hypothetical protein